MNKIVKNIFKIVAVLLIIAGGIWILQGINVLPGSFMTGDPQWAINGAITALAGAGLFWFANR
jgi:Trk-type K+ transport system membrane component